MIISVSPLRHALRQPAPRGCRKTSEIISPTERPLAASERMSSSTLHESASFECSHATTTAPRYPLEWCCSSTASKALHLSCGPQTAAPLVHDGGQGFELGVQNLDIYSHAYKMPTERFLRSGRPHGCLPGELIVPFITFIFDNP